MTRKILLKVSSLKVAYGGIQAVKGVDFEVAEGELLSPSAEVVAQMRRSSRGRRRLGETRAPAAEARDDIARARRNTRDGAGRAARAERERVSASVGERGHGAAARGHAGEELSVRLRFLLSVRLRITGKGVCYACYAMLQVLRNIYIM